MNRLSQEKASMMIYDDTKTPFLPVEEGRLLAFVKKIRC